MNLSIFGNLSPNSSSNFAVNIVAHSMGGLVARYYIENLGYDEHVNQLITIDTPHWGSDLAFASNLGGIFQNHVFCDHDLSPFSPIFSLSDLNSATCPACWLCQRTGQPITPPLNYDCNRATKYYAIAGINHYIEGSAEDISFDITEAITSKEELALYVSNKLSDNVDVGVASDNVVNFLSQIGWRDLNGSVRIDFTKIFVNVDTDGGNSLIDHLHSKMLHRTAVMEKIIEFLEE